MLAGVWMDLKNYAYDRQNSEENFCFRLIFQDSYISLKLFYKTRMRHI